MNRVAHLGREVNGSKVGLQVDSTGLKLHGIGQGWHLGVLD